VYKARQDQFEKAVTAWAWNGRADTEPNGPGSNFTESWQQYAYGTSEVITTESHPYQNLGKGTGDIGGPFLAVKRDYEHSSKSGQFRTNTNPTNQFAENVRCTFYAFDQTVTDASFPPPIFMTDDELAVKGTTAIANVIPTNPISSVLVTLGELRSEGIPNLIGASTWKARTLRAREAGEEYLNYQFGWLPLVSEISDFAHTVLKSDEISRKYESESGKLLHRRFTFPVENSEPDIYDEENNYPTPGIKTGYWTSTGQGLRQTSVKRRVWFSGAFTYYLPPIGSNERDLAIANKLYGVRPSPEVVWNLTPWTWAADWFVNAGDVIHNISAFSQDGLVMPYGYIMAETVHEYLYTHRGATLKTGGPVDVWQRLTTTVKQRKRASPYGFGVTFDSFSDRQWLILGALGLTRGSNGMKYE
jgi:hypothetical protein